MGSRGFEGDDVHALADAVDVACIGGVPESGGMALVGFGCKEELEGNVGGRGRVAEQRVRLVVGRDVRPQLPNGLLCSGLGGGAAEGGPAHAAACRGGTALRPSPATEGALRGRRRWPDSA